MVLAQKETHRSVEQNRKPGNKSMIICSVNLHQRKQSYVMGKSLFNKWHYENWTATCKRMKLNYFLLPWIKDLNMRPETIKTLEESIGSDFFEFTPTSF